MPPSLPPSLRPRPHPSAYVRRALLLLPLLFPGHLLGSDLPVPTDDRVTLREVPEQVYVVRQFSGNMGRGDGHDAVAERERTVAVEGVAAADGGAFAEFVSADSKYLVARCVSSRRRLCAFDLFSSLVRILQYCCKVCRVRPRGEKFRRSMVAREIDKYCRGLSVPSQHPPPAPPPPRPPSPCVLSMGVGVCLASTALHSVAGGHHSSYVFACVCVSG